MATTNPNIVISRGRNMAAEKEKFASIVTAVAKLLHEECNIPESNIGQLLTSETFPFSAIITKKEHPLIQARITVESADVICDIRQNVRYPDTVFYTVTLDDGYDGRILFGEFVGVMATRYRERFLREPEPVEFAPSPGAVRRNKLYKEIKELIERFGATVVFDISILHSVRKSSYYE